MDTRNLVNGTCPECRGPLTQIETGGYVEFECLVRHRYSPEALLQAHYETEERTLWAAVVAIEESVNLARAALPYLAESARERVERRITERLQQAQELREFLEKLRPFETSDSGVSLDAGSDLFPLGQ